MFLYNFKLNGKRIVKFTFMIILIIILVILSIGIYNIFVKKEENASSTQNSDIITLTDTIKTGDVFEITESNYTNILDAVTKDVDSYIGCKIHFVGYIYRLIDFDDNEFVLARDMTVNQNTSNTLVVGFLCTYDKAKDFPDKTWVDITGTIIKGDYYGDIAEIEVTDIKKCDEPQNKYVSQPDNTYIPTSGIL